MDSHLKTYTAGEDGSRLAAAAKEFGLQNQRRPRKQVRDESKGGEHFAAIGDMLNATTKNFVAIVNDHSVEVARMRAIYSLGYPRRQWSFSEYATESSQLLPAAAAHRRSRSGEMPDWLKDIEEQEEDLHAHGIGGDLTSAVLGIVKGMVGPAILYLPHGLAQAGWAVAFPLMALSTVMFLYSSQCLLECWKLEHNKRGNNLNDNPSATKKKSIANSRTPETISEGNEDDEEENGASNEADPLQEESPPRPRMMFLSYPELAYRALGETGEMVVKFGIGLMQSGVCLTYLIFVPQNFSTALFQLTGISVSAEWLLLVMVAVQMPLSWIRDIRKLTITNFVANALILYGLITCLFLALKQALTSEASTTTTVTDVPFTNATLTEVETVGPIKLLTNRLIHLDPFAKNWFLFIGTSVLLFEGSITLLVPLQEAVAKDEDRKRFPRVYQTTIISIIAFYVFFSLTCWVSLGNDVKTVLTTSLPPGFASTSVQLAYSFAVIFTFPLQNFPALEIACRSIADTIDSFSCCQPGNILTERNVISSALVALLAVVAVTTMNDLDKVVSLMGGLLGCPIAFVLPPMIHYKLAGKAGKLTTKTKLLNGLVASLGIVATVIATVTTLMTWD